MKSVGIVSCYFINNYGSVIQAYATQKMLDELGIKNETINVSGFLKQITKKQYFYILKSGLKSDMLRDRMGKIKNLLYRKIVKNEYTRGVRKREQAMRDFTKQYINKSVTCAGFPELTNYCQEHYDTVLIGSDQLWLPANIAADYYTLNFVPESVKKVAYATSFGVSSLPDDIKSQASSFLSKIDCISVREEAGKKIIQSLINRDVEVVCDPTLLFNGEQWMDIQDIEPIVKDDYIFCYFIGSSVKHRDFVKRLKQKKGYKIVALTHVDHYMECDENYADEAPYDVSPGQFLNLIRNAKYVCTDSFHCTVFSLLYNKIFFDFKRYTNESKQSTNSRLETLLGVVDLKNRMFSGDEEVEELLQMDIDFERVNNKLVAYRNQSKEYLIKALKLDREVN